MKKWLSRTGKRTSRRGIISHDTVVISTVGIFRGHELVNIAIYPAFYDPAGGYVDLISSMNVNIS